MLLLRRVIWPTKEVSPLFGKVDFLSLPEALNYWNTFLPSLSNI